VQPSTSPSIPVIGQPSGSASATPTVTPSNGNGHGGFAGGAATQTVNAVQVGATVGGAFSVLPGSLLWVQATRRRKRKKR
ncbi:MAG: hypothetical protein ACRDN0_08965, partial [Trebonia sp.]